MNKKLENKIRDNFKEALGRFDFAKAGNIMDFLNWCWWGKNYPPTHEEILITINELFEDALESFKENEKYIAHSSGGFIVTIFDKGGVGIQFVPVYSHSYN